MNLRILFQLKSLSYQEQKQDPATSGWHGQLAGITGPMKSCLLHPTSPLLLHLLITSCPPGGRGQASSTQRSLCEVSNLPAKPLTATCLLNHSRALDPFPSHCELLSPKCLCLLSVAQLPDVWPLCHPDARFINVKPTSSHQHIASHIAFARF